MTTPEVPPTGEDMAARISAISRTHPWLVAERDGIPLTSPARTILDLASVLPEHHLKRALAKAEVTQKATKLGKGAESVDQFPIAQVAPARHGLEPSAAVGVDHRRDLRRLLGPESEHPLHERRGRAWQRLERFDGGTTARRVRRTQVRQQRRCAPFVPDLTSRPQSGFVRQRRLRRCSIR